MKKKSCCALSGLCKKDGFSQRAQSSQSSQRFFCPLIFSRQYQTIAVSRHGRIQFIDKKLLAQVKQDVSGFIQSSIAVQ
jgi:hypothetical protein